MLATSFFLVVLIVVRILYYYSSVIYYRLGLVYKLLIVSPLFKLYCTSFFIKITKYTLLLIMGILSFIKKKLVRITNY